MVLPSNVLMFADGRVGAPITQLINQDSKAAKTIKNGTWGGWATFLIFSLENGHWMLDEQVSACNTQCREDSGLDQAATDRMFAVPSPVPGSTPASTPAASPIGRVEAGDLRS